MLDYIKTAPRIAGRSSTRENGAAFSGVENWQAAENLARNGWHDGAKRLKDGMAKAANSRAGSRKLARRTVRSYDVAGDECDVARFCAGEIENMVTTRRVLTKGKTVKVIRCAVSFSCKVSSKKIEDYAVAVACAVQRIEQRGQRVELWATKSCAQELAPKSETQTERGRGVVFSMATKIKSANARLHPAALAFACHPAFLRRLGFAVLEREKGAAQVLTRSGYGYGCDTPGATGFLTSEQSFYRDADVDRAIAELQKAGGEA